MKTTEKEQLRIKLYAESMVKHKIYSNMGKAMVESKRFFKKLEHEYKTKID